MFLVTLLCCRCFDVSPGRATFIPLGNRPVGSKERLSLQPSQFALLPRGEGENNYNYYSGREASQKIQAHGPSLRF